MKLIDFKKDFAKFKKGRTVLVGEYLAGVLIRRKIAAIHKDKPKKKNNEPD